MTSGLFVTGTDTGVGKTLIAQALLVGLRALGLRVVGMKPVASGSRHTPGGSLNEDAQRLQRLSTGHPSYAEVNPYAYEPPIAPHIAAEEAGRPIDIATILEHYRRHALGADRIVVEGIGGWLVPLSDAETVEDLARALALPVLLVVSARLGCINHALLTARAIQGAGLVLCGWVANCPDSGVERLDTIIDSLAVRIDAPLLGRVPALPDAAPERVLQYLHLTDILTECGGMDSAADRPD